MSGPLYLVHQVQWEMKPDLRHGMAQSQSPPLAWNPLQGSRQVRLCQSHSNLHVSWATPNSNDVAATAVVTPQLQSNIRRTAHPPTHVVGSHMQRWLLCLANLYRAASPCPLARPSISQLPSTSPTSRAPRASLLDIYPLLHAIRYHKSPLPCTGTSHSKPSPGAGTWLQAEGGQPTPAMAGSCPLSP